MLRTADVQMGKVNKYKSRMIPFRKCKLFDLKLHCGGRSKAIEDLFGGENQSLQQIIQYNSTWSQFLEKNWKKNEEVVIDFQQFRYNLGMTKVEWLAQQPSVWNYAYIWRDIYFSWFATKTSVFPCLRWYQEYLALYTVAYSYFSHIRKFHEINVWIHLILASFE